MGLIRRLFRKEFKLAAVRRLEQGVSIAEVARALEVNPNVLHRWRREFPQGPGNAFPGNGIPRWSERQDRRAGAQGRPAGARDRVFEGVHAALLMRLDCFLDTDINSCGKVKLGH